MYLLSLLWHSYYSVPHYLVWMYQEENNHRHVLLFPWYRSNSSLFITKLFSCYYDCFRESYNFYISYDGFRFKAIQTTPAKCHLFTGTVLSVCVHDVKLWCMNIYVYMLRKQKPFFQPATLPEAPILQSRRDNSRHTQNIGSAPHQLWAAIIHVDPTLRQTGSMSSSVKG